MSFDYFDAELDEELDAWADMEAGYDAVDEYDAISGRGRPVSTDRYEASIFMKAGRVAQITRYFAAILANGVKRGRYSKMRLLRDSNYRNQVTNIVLMQAIRRVYRQVNGHASPSHSLTRHLVAAYKSKTNTARTVLRILSSIGGALFEDEADYEVYA